MAMVIITIIIVVVVDGGGVAIVLEEIRREVLAKCLTRRRHLRSNSLLLWSKLRGFRPWR